MGKTKKCGKQNQVKIKHKSKKFVGGNPYELPYS
jgi:hypothetical protein